MTLTIHLKSGKKIVYKYKRADDARVAWRLFDEAMRLGKNSVYLDAGPRKVSEIIVFGSNYRGQKTVSVCVRFADVEFVQLDAPISEDGD